MPRRDNPFDDIERMFERMQDQLEGELEGAKLTGSVAVDVAERDDEFVVTADLPGFEREDVSVELTDEALRIEAEHTEERGQEEERFVRRERSRQSLSRSVPLPGPADAEGAEATFTNGVLSVSLPKAGGDDSRRIDID
jgi:HSP20 family protein